MTNTVTQHPIGTPLWFSPIRYWEDTTPETGIVALHTNFSGDKVLDSFSEGSVYAFHDDYGHTVYMPADRTFLSEADAIADAEARSVVYFAEEKVQMDALMEKIYARIEAEKVDDPDQAMGIILAEILKDAEAED